MGMLKLRIDCCNISVSNPNNKDKNKIKTLKNDCHLFSKLYIATSEHRSGDLDQFFSHENQSSPPSLSVSGIMRSGTKSDLLRCLLNIPTECITSTPTPPEVSVKILDGPAIVHMLNPGVSETFADYADKVFIPFIRREMSSVTRLDLVWDVNRPDSLKVVTRQKRGPGLRTKVEPNTKVPKGWANFLRVDTNKVELFDLLTTRCLGMDVPEGKEINITQNTAVLSNFKRNRQIIEPCDHEEADTRMLLHVVDCVDQGHKNVMLRTVDTDVVVIAISCVSKLPTLCELWIHMGTGQHHNYIACHSIAHALGPDKSEVLPIFHSFTGCDTVSFFNGKGKKTAFVAWSVYPEATKGFKALKTGDFEQAEGFIQKYVISMYDRSSPCTRVNECQKYLFTKKDRNLENIPPTEAALRQHALRAVYQGGLVWGQVLKPQLDLPSPSLWGWKKEESDWTPHWSDLPDVASACIELTRCRCKTGCKLRCSCVKSQKAPKVY